MKTSNSNDPHAVVIGSGFGGLAAAVRLGAKGYRVTVLEYRDKPGGRAYVYEQDGFKFDGGPTVVTAPYLFNELWDLAGKRFEDDVDLRPVTPFYAVRFDDGSRFNYTGDAEQMRKEIAKIDPRELSGYERFLARSRTIFDVGYKQLADVPFNTFGSMIKIAPKMMQLESYRTVYGLVSRYIKNEKLRQVLSFHTLLVGGNPFSTTSIYALISALEREWGVHFPMGGTGVLVDGLVNIIEGQGGRFRFNTEVKELLLDGRKARGVRLASGEVIEADLVVSNADSAWLYRNMVPAEARRRWTDRKIDKAKFSMSLFVWYFGTKRRYDDVDHHTILLGPRYKGLLSDIFDKHVLADDFSLYLHRPTATDPSLAPEGHDGFYVLSPVPHLDSGTDWRQAAEPYRKKIEQYLSDSVLPGLADEVVTSHMLTPQGFRDEMLSVKGAAFGLQPVLTQSAYFRPHNISEEVDGLYLVGAGTHPGAGLPGVLSSAKVIDRVIPAVGEPRRAAKEPSDVRAA